MTIDPGVRWERYASTAMADDRQLTAQGQERKEQLLDCAAELFAERGYAETRVIDIVKRAGVAKGLFYWYFDNKESLFRELVEVNRLALRRAERRAMDRTAEPLLQLRQGTEASLHFQATHAAYFTLTAVENVDKQFFGDLRKGIDVHVADVAALVKRGIADGSIREDDPELLAYGVVTTVGNYGRYHRTGRLDMDAAELAPFVSRFIVCALAADEEIARRVLAAQAYVPSA